MLTREQFQQLDEIVTAGLELPVEERLGFLTARCAGDDELLREARSLVELDPADAFLEPVATAPDDLARYAVESSMLAGQVLGAWRLERLLGRGGMGSVYLASRADGRFDRKVAVKLLDVLVGEGGFEERFGREREILARLHHPNIAGLLDAGTSPNGLSYFVLEYVEGKACTQWLKGRNAGIGETLRVFVQICEAVQFAHGNLVVHRDLKPSNILVDENGQPHLLDFGIAKLLDPARDNDTRTGFRAFSLNYASPEQILGKPASTADDVYALGVLLYEMLAGQAPYRLAGRDLLEILRFTEAPKYAAPSEAADGAQGAALRGDLDAVVLKAMAADRPARYESAAALAADLERYVGGFPVLARRPGRWYAARKFAVRHRVGVGAAGLAVALAGAAAGAIAWQASEARKNAAEAVYQRDVADEQRALAERRSKALGAAAQAEAAAKELAEQNARSAVEQRDRAVARFKDVRSLARFLIFELEPAAQSVPGATPLRKKMADEAVRYLARLSSTAQSGPGEVELWRDLEDAYTRLGLVQGDPASAFNLGDPAAALHSYREAAAAAEQVMRLRPADREAKRRAADAYVTLAMQLRSMKNETGFAAAMERASGLLQKLSAEAPGDEGILRAQARVAFSVRDYAKYTELSERLLLSHPGDKSLQRYAALGHKYLAGARGASAARIGHAERALALDSAILAGQPGDPGARLDLSFDLSMLASLKSVAGNHAEAAKLYGQVTEIRRELRGADPANVRFAERLAVGLEFLGLELIEVRNFEGAKAAFEEAGSIARTLAGKVSAGLDRQIEASALAGLADVAEGIKDTAAACRYATEALRMAEALKPRPGVTFPQPLAQQYEELQLRVPKCAAMK